MHFTGLLKIIVRNFRKNIAVSLIKVSGLAISVASVIIIWSYVINENRYDGDVPDRERIFRLDAHWASLPSFLGDALNQNTGSQVLSTRLNFWEDVGIQIKNNPFNLKELLFADSTFFKVFQFDLNEGNTEDALSRPFSLVLSESAARRLFGKTDPLGKIIRFQNQWNFTVTGIIKDQPFLHFRTDVIASLVSLEYIRYKGVLREYDGWNYPTYLILPKSVPAEKSKKAVLDLLKKVGYNDPFKLKPFPTIYYSAEVENESNTKHGNLLYNRILIAVSIFILVLAAINFINLTIANALARSKEVSLKKLQGAQKSQLIIQFLIETVFFILISIAFSFVLIWFVEPVLSSLTGFYVSISDFFTHCNIWIFSTAVIAFIVTTGIYPSIYISSYNINSDKKGFAGQTNHIWIRNVLIVFQNLVSITLISCTLFANQQFQFMKKKDLGFNKKEIINLKINSQLTDHLDSFRETLLKNPGIMSLSYSSRIPGNYWGSWCCVNIEGKENKFFNNYVDPDYLKTMGIRIKDGRNFSKENQADMNATYLINETAIRLYNIKDPIGQEILPGNGIKGQIVGIIQDFHYRGLNYEQSPLLLFNTENYLNYINIKVDRRNIPGALEKIKEAWEEICPAFSFEYSFLDETYDLQYRSEKRFENLLFAFTLLAIFIASMGILGLSIYSTERRTKEIGIRKINGAKVSEIMLMLNAGILKWITISFVMACPISWYAMNRWLQSFAYKTDLSLWVFVLAGIIAFLSATVTVSWLSWKAANRNPVDALRYE